MMLADILFYIFATVLIAGAVGVVTARNPMYCVLFMILTFFNAAGLFLLVGAEFLALLLVMVYVGAIAVMFLFVVMTINIDEITEKEGFVKNLPIAAIIGFVLLAEFIFAAWSGVFSGTSLPAVASLPMTQEQNIVQFGNVLFTKYVYPFITASMILLVAMVGAIVLAHRKRGDVKRQNIAEQIARKREDCIEMVDIKPGAGIK